MFGDVEDEEGRNTFVFSDVGDGGVVAVFGRIVTEFGAVAERRQRKAMDAAAGFGGFDDGGDVVGVAVDWNAAFDDGEGESFGLEIAVVGANEGGELCASGVAHDENAAGIAAVLSDVIVDPAEGFGDIAKDGGDFDVWKE